MLKAPNFVPLSLMVHYPSWNILETAFIYIRYHAHNQYDSLGLDIIYLVLARILFIYYIIS